MSISVPDTSMINDIRIEGFGKLSFSNYKLVDVRKQLMENMIKGKIESSCYWSAELICSGCYSELWETIFYFVGKHIHIGNPKIPIYLNKRYTVFKNIMNNKYFNFELDLRNNGTIRTLFSEVVVILCLSAKKPGFESLKINREEEFDMTYIRERFKAKDTTLIQPIFDKEDATELFICMNELAYHIGGPKPNMQEACYWVEWIIEFDLLCRKRKHKCLNLSRNINVENKFRRDSIWLLWDVLLHFSEKKENATYVKSILLSIRDLFCVKYGQGTPKKRKYLLYFAIELLTENVPINVELISDKKTLEIVTSKIHDIYKQIKKNEISPKTEYLFKDMEKSNNLENSIKKMSMIENIDFVPRLNE